MTLSRLCVVVALALTTAGLNAATPKQMSVVVKTTQVRSAASYLGGVLGTLSYGDRVDVLEKQNDWARVKLAATGLSGWTNLTALTEKNIVLSSGSGNVSQNASSGEVALAGKGFNEQIETQYKQDGKLDYTWVDAMGKLAPAPEAVLAFLSAGGLNGGGAQ